MIVWHRDEKVDHAWYGEMQNDKYNFVLFLLDGSWVLAIFVNQELLFETPCNGQEHGKQSALRLLSKELRNEAARISKLYSNSDIKSPWS